MEPYPSCWVELYGKSSIYFSRHFPEHFIIFSHKFSRNEGRERERFTKSGKISDFITHETVFALQKLNLRHVRSKCAPHTIMIIHRNSFGYDFSVPKLSTFAWSPLIMPLHLPHFLFPFSFILFIGLELFDIYYYIATVTWQSWHCFASAFHTYFEPRTYIFLSCHSRYSAYTFSLKFMIFNFGIKSKCVIALASNS